MVSEKLHADEFDIDALLVAELLRTQFPWFEHLSLAMVRSAGTDNVMYRLGDELVVRLPRTPSAALQVDKEQRWLPLLGPALTCAVPQPVGKGAPEHDYPHPWSIYRWIDGQSVAPESVFEPARLAAELGRFVQSLRICEAAGGPLPGPHNFSRGVPLVHRDQSTRAAISAVDGLVDTEGALRAWEAALAVPEWRGAPVWIHGDLQSGNLLVRDGVLAAVIDFGGLGVGDPACDAMIGWTLFDRDTRETFREYSGVDDDTWARGRGWALSVGLSALPYYATSNRALADVARRGICEVLADSSG
ncbi:aminoglycoside phosphotransferase family protein [Rhodococcus sp. 27YEA15]|uniref:aminoglycoside phosphotransferase family protein n=1 Tax=Rhodococcus sp. 27YEA15 TaxID=3156259 RepID=UPI003C7E4942